MPRSSRHKSHKQSKHSSRDARELSDLEEDVKMKDRNGKEEGSVRVSKDSGSIEKRKHSLSKDPSGHSNGGTAEEYVASKRRKEKGDANATSGRWNGSGDERGVGATVEKEVKGENPKIDADKSSKSKVVVELKNKSSRRHESSSGKKEDNVDIGAEKEESKSTSRIDSKRKSEKESGKKEVQQCKDSKESKETERGIERESKIRDIERETKAAVNGELAGKDCGEERQGKRGRENNEWPIQEGLQNHELEAEIGKWIRRRKDHSSDKDKYQDDTKEHEDGRIYSRGERSKDGKYKDEKHKDGNYGDEHCEDGDRGSKHRDDNYREDAKRDIGHRDVKSREDGDRDYRHRKSKYLGERDNRHKDDRQRDAKYREDDDEDTRHRDDRYREDGDRDNRHRDDKYHQDGDREIRHRGDKYREGGERDDRCRDDRYLEDGNRDSKIREDAGKDSRYREEKQRDDNDKDKRLRDVKYRDEQSSRDRRSDRSDIKHLRIEISTADLHHRKSSNGDGSPISDDQSSRYKERRRTSDKEDYGETRSQSTKDLRSDAEKKSLSSVRVELVCDRGRSNSCSTYVETTPNNSRRRNSPNASSHAVKDHYRLSKQEESKYRDYGHEERTSHDVTSSKEYLGVLGVLGEKASLSRSIEKSLPKDDGHLGEISDERHVKEDARTSPSQMVDESPSSLSTERRQLTRSDVRRSLDIEDSGQRSGDLRDGKVHHGREGRGSRELPMQRLPYDELSQADVDNFSVSTPFGRMSHLSSNPRSLLPPPSLFRRGADSPLDFGSLEEDNRGKPNNRYGRIGDPGVGRVQGSAWRGVSNWPSPMPNGFIPFPHGPPSVGFHPVMPQFPAPPMFSVRSSIELNQSGVPYHVSDGDRFSGHAGPLGWRNPMDDSWPPPIHGWHANSTVFGDESRIYGRLNWDHNRSLSGGQVWEASSGSKGHNSGVSTELPSAVKRDYYSACGPDDEVWPGQSGLQPNNDEKKSSDEVESIDIDQSSDVLEKNILEAPKTILEEIPKLSRKDGEHLSHLYLSMLDISVDLTQPELYSQYTNLMGTDQNTTSEEDDSKFLPVEEAIDATVKISNKTSRASIFPTVNDSVLQKAMSLYKKLREVRAVNGEKVPFYYAEDLESAATLEQEGAASKDKQGEAVPDCDQPEAVHATSALKLVKMEGSLQITNDKIDEPVLDEDKVEAFGALNQVKMEVDPVPSEGTLDSMVEDKPLSPENVDRSESSSLGEAEEVNGDSDGSRSTTNNEGQKLHGTKCGLLLFSAMSTDTCEALLPESIKSGSVNLSRIHLSPESTR